MDITVLCIDRDLTVNVNFNPNEIEAQHGVEDAKPVPLSWVKEYAHNVPHVDVWATGNAHLRREAEIYGVQEAKLLWEEYNGRVVTSEYPDTSPHSYKPERRERLRLIQDIYEAYSEDESIQYVVVDDVNLGDMEKEGWLHLYPWEFVESTFKIENTEYTSTSVESKACNEDVERNHDNLDRLIEKYE